MATKYWRNLTPFTWSSTACWSNDSPSGTAGAAIPVIGDDVVISNVGQAAGTINITATATAKLNSWTVIGGTWTVAGSQQVNIAGTFDCRNVTWTNTGVLSLQGTGGSYDINASGTTFSCAVTLNAFIVASSSFNLLSAFTTGATQTTTLTAGTLILNNFTWTTGIFNTNATNTREIQFGTGNIALIHTTAATTVLVLSNYTNFTCSGTGGFTSAMSTTRTFNVGSTGASNSITVNLALTSGASVPTFAAGGWFNHLNFTGSSVTVATLTVNVNSLTLASGGTYTALTVNAVGTGTITPAGKSLAAFTVNHTGTTTLSAALGTLVTGTTTLTLGTLDLAGFTLTTGTFSSSQSNTRAIAFGAGNIVLSHTTIATTVLSMAIATGFTWTGTGGFTVAAMSNTRTFTFGTTGGTTSNAPNLTFTTGASVATITTASWFNKLDYGTTSFTQAASTLNLNALTLSSTGTYTALILSIRGTGTLTYNGKTTAAVTLFAGTPTLSGTLACTTFTVNGPAFDFTSGTINPSTSFVLTSGSFTYNGGTLGAVPTFTHTAGTVTFNYNYSLTATGTYTLTAGTLTLATGITLTTGIFASSGTSTRAITFGTGNIVLSHTTLATTVLSMATATGFTYTGTGGFTVADMAVTRTFAFGTTGGTTSNAPNLTFTTGASIATITTGSWFNTLDFGTTSFNPGTTTLNLNSLTLSSSGTYTTLTAAMRGTGTITSNGKSTGPLVINNGAGTTTLAAAALCTTFTMTAGTINFVTFTLTCSAGASYTAGTLSNIGTITCTTWTVTGTFTLTQGTITPSTSFVLTSGAFNYNGGTLSAVPTFTHTAGTVTFNYNYSLTATGTYTHTAGVLTLTRGSTLATGIFSSSGSGTRSISFGSSISSTTGSLYFSGTTFTTTTNSAFSMGTEDFTVEGWAWMDSSSDALAGIICSVSGSSSGFGIARDYGGGMLNASGAGGVSIGWLSPLSTSTWFHFALTMQSNTLRLFKDGVLQGTTTNTYSGLPIQNSSNIVSLATRYAGGSSWPFAGYFSNIRIVRGVAVYTAAFTPPALQLSSTQLANTNGNPSAAITGTQTTLLLNTAYGSAYLTDSSTYNSTTTSGSLPTSNKISPYLSDINLTHTTTATVVLSMATTTGFTYTGPGGFTVAAMSNTRTFTFGSTAGGTTTNAPNLTFTTGANVATLTTASWFNTLDFGTTSFNPGTTSVNVNTITLSSGGTYTALGANMIGTGTLTYNGKTTAALTINSAGTTTVAGGGVSCTTFTITAGTIDFATFSLTCTNSLTGDTDLFAPAGTVNLNNITCGTTYTVNGTVTMTSGQSLTTTTQVVTATAFTFNGGTVTTPLFSHTSGTVTLGANLSPGVTGQYTLTAGTLNLAGFTLTTGIFFSSNANTRDIAFGTGNIALSHTTIATTVLQMTDATAFTWTGTGGFTVPAMSNTRTFVFGLTSGGTTNAPNLTFTTGASVATLTTNGWFNTLDFGTTSFNPGTTTLNLNGLTLSSGGTYTSLTATMVGTGTINYNTKSTGPLTINSAGTTTVAGGGVSCTTFTITAGTIDFATFSLTCTNSLTGDTDLFAPAGTVNLNNITCGTTYTVNGTVTMTSGQSLTTTTQVVTATAFTFNGGTVTTPLFSHTSGTVTLGANLSPGVTGQYTLTAGTLNLAGFTLTTGIFFSSNANTRDIAFGTGNIALSHTTAATTVLSMNDVTAFTLTGTGGFTVPAMSNTRTFNFGAGAGGAVSNAPNLTFTTGASVATLTTQSWFNTLDFGTTSFNPGTTLIKLNSLTLSSGGTYTSLTASQTDTGTITSNGKSLAALTVNHTGTATLADALSVVTTGTTTLTQGTLDLAGFTLTTGAFSSSNVNTRAIAFGTSNIVLTHTTTATTVLSMNDVTAFTWTGTGGFTVNAMSVARTFSFGNTGTGTTSNAPNLTFTTGAGVATITTGGWFKTLNFGTTSFTPGTTTLNLINLTLSSSGTYTPLTATMVDTGTITSNGKSLAALTVNHTGTTTLADALGVSVAGGFTTLTQGTLDLAGFTLTTGRFSSTNSNTRAIAFGTGNIALADTSPTTVLSMADATAFTLTGTGGFTTAMSVNRVFTFGATAGGTTSNAPNLTFTTGANTGSISGASWFNTLNFGTTSFNPGTTSINVNNITLSSSGTYTSLTVTMVGTGTITNNGKTLAGFGVDSAGTATLSAALSVGVTGTTTLTQGTLDLAGFTLTTGIFSSDNGNTRAIAFGTGNIALSHTTAATAVLQMNTATGFTRTGTGGFTVPAMSVTRTFYFGAVGGTTSNAPNLTFTTGASIAAFADNSWFNTLNFGTTSFNPDGDYVTLNINSITLSSSGTYTELQLRLVGSGTLTTNGKTTYSVTLVAGTTTFADTITCDIFGVDGATFNFTSGTINPSTSFVLTSGSFTYNGGTLGVVPTFTHTAGTVTFNYNYSLTGTYTLTAGTLTLADGVTLTVAGLSSSNSTTRSIAFGSASPGNINTEALTMATLTGFTRTGPGGFTVPDMSVTRTFTCGSTAGGTTSNAPNLAFTTGASVATLTTASWFNTLDFGTTSFNPGTTTLNLNALTLSSSGTYTTLTAAMRGTGTITNNGKTIAALTINSAGTTTLAAALTMSGALTLTQGTLACSIYILQSATFASTGTATRSMTGSGTYTITGSGATFIPAFSNASAAGITITGLFINMNSVSAKTFAGGGGSYGILLCYPNIGTLSITGSNSFADIQVPSGLIYIEYLVVAGGGAGGTGYGGGGGGGGYLTATGLGVAPSSVITVTVGAGGTGSASPTAGDNSQLSNGIFANVTAIGGGVGQYSTNSSNGGSGGGATLYSGSIPGTGTVGQGTNGGTSGRYSTVSYGSGGGGGGAGAGGYAGSGDGIGTVASTGDGTTGGNKGNGGAGLYSSITGSSVAYAGGGGGGTWIGYVPGPPYYSHAGDGGVGGGGNGAYVDSGMTAGTVNTGGGGGGASAAGASGGSGVVIIRYADTYAAATSTTGSPTITVAGGYRVYQWTSSGTITF